MGELAGRVGVGLMRLLGVPCHPDILTQTLDELRFTAPFLQAPSGLGI